MIYIQLITIILQIILFFNRSFSTKDTKYLILIIVYLYIFIAFVSLITINIFVLICAVLAIVIYLNMYSKLK
jgi:hypothetical protein